MISEIVPVFSGKPLFGYRFVAGSGIAIGFLSFSVWAHHMFAVGLGDSDNAFFSAESMLIAVPTGVKIFNWLATMWRGRIRLAMPMVFATGFIATFVIGGLTGVSLAVVPLDLYTTDSQYVVGHLHYVLFGGTVMAVFAGLYYWFPKVTGRLLGHRLGLVHFWLTFVGLTAAFLPMHWLGIQGMPRRGARGGRSVGCVHPRVVDAVAAASPQLRGRARRPRQAAALGPQASRPAGSAVSAQANAIPFGRDRNLLGVGLFIASESLFFLAIVSAYVVFRAQGLATARAELDVGRTALFSALLFASSGTMGLAVSRRSRAWLALTALRGAGFP